MRKLYLFFIFLFSITLSILASIPIYAISSNLVISQVQTRSLLGGSASEELVEIYNNSDLDTDITNWCINYGASNIITPTKSLVCINHSIPSTYNKIFIPKRSSAVFVSKIFNEIYPNFGYDMIFPSGLSDAGRWISIINDSNDIIDTVEWGPSETSSTAEGGIASVLPNSTQLIQRKSTKPGELLDTDNNFNDFELSNTRTVYNYGSIYETTFVDYCTNIEGLQSTIPDGYESDNENNCTIIPIDICENIDGVQEIMPEGYKKRTDGGCFLDIFPIIVTELLPNAISIDDGNEFIELYNPTDFNIDLSNYYLHINDIKYNFPQESGIPTKQYISFSNNDIKFTLLNTTSKFAVYSIDGQLVFEVPLYVNPDEGASWALIDGVWQYTNQPTPGLENIVSIINIENEIKDNNNEITPCAANQYRSLETGRCRLLPVSILTPCKDGQYRSEETNRCRNILSDANILTPCAEGQERNPETNRCRSITAVLGVNSLTPCKEGQERNPETNRCRNIVGDMPDAEYAPQQTNENSNNSILWFSVLGVVLVAVGYGMWEWRTEIANIFNKFISKKI